MSSSMSGIIESQILHTTATRMLHAHNFTKSSTQATYTLTDVLSRYLTLLAGTCAQFAQHAGRTGVTVHDALAALEEIGVGIDELREYAEGEARELVRYTGQTSRRAEELAELKTSLAEGMKQDHSDAVQLVYASVNEVEAFSSEDGDEGSEMQFKSFRATVERFTLFREKDLDMALDMPRTLDPYPDGITPSSPHLPLSPISPPHARKRARTSNWKAPDYIPDFLPPFPGQEASVQESPLHPVSFEMQVTETSLPAPTPVRSPTIPIESKSSLESQAKPQPLLRPSSPALPTSTSISSSYLSSISYEHSSLASVPEWHLPHSPSDSPFLPQPSTLPALLSSYSFLQSSSLSAPPLQTPNPLRHGLAMMLLGMSSHSYSPAATLFASSHTNMCAPLPHRAAPLAAHAIPLDKNGRASFDLGAQRGKLPVPPPDWHGRSASGPVAIVDSTAVQGSRIAILARTVLPAPIIARATRLLPPSALERNNQKLLYGPPVPAPWNSASGINAAESKSGRGGKDKDEEDEEEDKVLSDAHLFATWDYDPKDFRTGLPPARRGSKIGLGGTNGSMPQLKRKRSDTVSSSQRRGSEGSTIIRIKTER